MSETFGALKRVEDYWVIPHIAPHVAIKLKRVFPRLPQTQAAPFSLKATDDVAADLAWFTGRYPLEMDETTRNLLTGSAAAFVSTQADLRRILSAAWTPSAQVRFKPGRSPYPYQAQAAELARKTGGLLVMDDIGMGKQQPLTARLLTPTGWKTIADAHVGMAIIGKDGRNYGITGVYPQGVKPAYRVTFSDGASTECGIDHLWKVRDQNRRLRGKGWAVKPLRDILRQGIRTKQNAPKWEIPMVDAVEFAPAGSLPIAPYVLGVLIGDGYLGGSTVTFSVPPAKQQILERVAIFVGVERLSGPHACDASPQWHILGETYGKNSCRRSLDAMGLCVPSKERFVPPLYLRASSADRLELLRGLMDTDGSCCMNRSIFSTCAPRLAEDVAELTRSLGGIASVRRYDRTNRGKPIEWQVSVRLSECPFTLPYKASGWRCDTQKARPCRYICNVQEMDAVQQRCIAVSAPDNLYVTDDFIVTHNTVTALAAVADPAFLPALIVVEPHVVDQWMEEFIESFTTLTAHAIKSTTPYALPVADLYVSTYTKLSGWIDYFRDAPFKSIIFDEVQSLRGGLDTNKGLAAQVLIEGRRMVCGLSATPIYNYGDEIFAVMEFIKPGALGTHMEFIIEWCRPGGGHWEVKDPAALGSFLISNHLAIRRTEDDTGQQMPPVNSMTYTVPYDEEQAMSAEDLARQLAIKVTSGSFHERGQAARELDALARHTTGMAKAMGVAQFCKMLAHDRPIILSGWHRSVYDVWLRELAIFDPVMFTGSETAKQKRRAKEAFVRGDSQIMIMSLRSGAGIDGLQERCSCIIHGELDWSKQVHNQLRGRLRRPGQKNQVDEIFLITDQGSDPTIVEVLGIKASQAHGIIDPFRAPAAKFTDDSRIKRLAHAYLDKARQPSKSHLCDLLHGSGHSGGE